MSIGRFRTYLPNPFLGTHSSRLTLQTAKAVETYVRKGPKNYAKKEKSLFDIAFAHPNFCVGRKFQKKSWAELDQDPSNPDHYWLVTRLVPKTRVWFLCIRTYNQHPHRRHGKAWGVLVWKGQLWNNGEERPIWGATVRKWRLVGEPQKKVALPSTPKVDLEELIPSLRTAEASE